MRTALITAAGLSLLAQPAGAATRNFGVSGFTRIRVEGPYQVHLATGIAPFAKATGSPAALDSVAVEMRGDTLIVRSSPSWGGYPGTDVGPVEISIGTHDLDKAGVLGAGSIAIDRVKGLSFALTVEGSGSGEIGHVEADRLDVTLMGTARAKVSGKALKLSTLVRGTSTLDAAGLVTPNAAISLDGTASVDANVTDTARIDGWGPARVRLSGQPSCAIKVSGSTSVSGCRKSQ